MSDHDDWMPDAFEHVTPDAFGPDTPAAVIAVPAAGRADLRGNRVLIGLPGMGWRGDLRADRAMVQSSRTFVPVLPESEWYRAEAEQIAAFAALIPVERVWMEIPEDVESPALERDVVGRLVSLDTPPRRIPVPVRDSPSVTGRRLVQAGRPEVARDIRALTEPYQGVDGDICVRVCGESDWYRWGWSGQWPLTREVPIHLLWCE